MNILTKIPTAAAAGIFAHGGRVYGLVFWYII